MRKFQLTLSEYNRIYQVAHGVLRDVGKSEKACIFFACFGAMILNKYYKIPARAVAGGFALNIDKKPGIVFFGQFDEERLKSSSDAFHMWVQTETHIIDFMAPIFPEAFADTEAMLSIPRKMFQRPQATEAKTPEELEKTGDFLTLPNPELTESLINNFLAREQNIDLLKIAEVWFGSHRKEQKKNFAMQDNLGEVFMLSLPKSTAIGAW